MDLSLGRPEQGTALDESASLLRGESSSGESSSTSTSRLARLKAAGIVAGLVFCVALGIVTTQHQESGSLMAKFRKISPLVDTVPSSSKSAAAAAAASASSASTVTMLSSTVEAEGLAVSNKYIQSDGEGARPSMYPW